MIFASKTLRAGQNAYEGSPLGGRDKLVPSGSSHGKLCVPKKGISGLWSLTVFLTANFELYLKKWTCTLLSVKYCCFLWGEASLRKVWAQMSQTVSFLYICFGNNIQCNGVESSSEEIVMTGWFLVFVSWFVLKGIPPPWIGSLSETSRMSMVLRCNTTPHGRWDFDITLFKTSLLGAMTYRETKLSEGLYESSTRKTQKDRASNHGMAGTVHTPYSSSRLKASGGYISSFELTRWKKTRTLKVCIKIVSMN